MNAFIDRLRIACELSVQEISLLENACSYQKSYPAQKDLILEGGRPGPVYVVLEGWACCYKLLPEGTRQITAFLMPGDCCGMHSFVLNRMEHSVATITPSRIAVIPRELVDKLITTNTGLRRAFRWVQMVDQDTLRAWIASIGRRSSVQRVAHLMCELHVRACNVGYAINGRLPLPLTQAELGDALGLTAVHVNRVLRKLRIEGAMRMNAGSLTVFDVGKLRQIAGFDENYLHLQTVEVDWDDPFS